MKKILTILAFVALTSPSLMLAQEGVVPDPQEELDGPGAFTTFVEPPEGTVSCFDYYEFNSVEIQISNDVESALPGVEQVFSVEMINQNPYPLVDGKLFVKIFRERDDNVDTQINGDNVIDSFVAVPEITLPVNGVATAQFAWTPSQYLPAGEYYVAGYFITADRFNMAGLSFTDDIIGGRGGFTMVSEEPAFYFNKDAVMIDENEHQFIAAAPMIASSTPVTVVVPIQNDSDESRTGMVTWNVFYWDAQREEQLVDTVEEAVTVPAGGSVDISYILTNNQHSVYLVEPTLSYNGEVVSQVGVRMVREGVDAPRINFPALTSFPLPSGEETTLFSCLHNGGTNALVPNTKLDLTLTDSAGNVVHSYSYEGDTTGDMMAVAESFAPELSYNVLNLTAALSHDGKVVDEVTVTYDCNEIDPESCLDISVTKGSSEGIDLLTFFDMWKWALLALLAILLLVFAVFRFLRGSELNDTNTFNQ